MEKQNLQNLRHSLAHLLAAAVLELWPDAKHAIGPAIEDGFYYDFDFPEPVGEDDLPKIEKQMWEILPTWDKFEKIEVSADEAKKQFKNNSYKLEMIDELKNKGEEITFYKSGGYIDLCRGGHVKSAKEIDPETFKLTTIAGAYWRGSEKNKMLTRIYGIAFKTKKDLGNYLKLQEEIGKRDHRKIGERLDLFSFHEFAPGAPFWHHNGMIIFKELEKLIRQELDQSGYQEISTPIMVKKEIFEKSGHFQYYRENMFYWKQEDETYVLKPMNCPESTYIYNSKIESYRDLPLRLAEIGRLHRNEPSGVLGGLFRVKQITMDDAHIYCRPDQVKEEISNLLKLVKKIYNLFGFTPEFYLATRPNDALGDEKSWIQAEKALESTLKENKVKFELKPKDGAFYGPKIDVHIKDALGRDWQLATIQLDLMMLPEKFNLHYIDQKGRKQRPMVIHRAIFGSFERFIGILVEHFAGALPLWLSPVQAEVINVGAGQKKYAEKIFNILKDNGIRARLSSENLTVSKRIREAELQKIPYILVVGEKEEKNKSVNVRHFRRGQEGEVKIEKLIEKIKQEITEKAI